MPRYPAQRYHFVMSRYKKASQARASARELVQVAKAIGHPARLRILAMLEGRTLCVCQMTAMLELASSTVSGHLNDLRHSGLVIEEKQGKQVFYEIDESGPFAELVTDALAAVSTDPDIVRDRALIERVRAVPIEVLTRAGMRLDRVGIRPPVSRARANS